MRRTATVPIQPARLKAGVTLKDVPGPRHSDAAGDGAARLIRGKALVFWDPKVPGKKREAIDTDQITPAADCVSESLETLDERGKAGPGPRLSPDGRDGRHRRAT